MRHLRIILINLNRGLEYRMRSFIWFLLSLLGPLMMILFWRGSVRHSMGSWTLSELNSYYFLIIIAAASLVSHSEDDVAKEDIQDGQLVSYLLRPYSYYWSKFFEEIPFRILQGLYGIISLILFFIFLKTTIIISHDPAILVLATLTALLALFISFTYKVILGQVAFWLIDTRGVFELSEIAIILFAGFNLPIELFPHWLRTFSLFTPFPYIVYFPVISFLGRQTVTQIMQTVLIQLTWLGIFLLFRQWQWRQGIKKFSGVGT